MGQAGYSFEEIDDSYFFTSIGRRAIDKIVEFSPLYSPNMFNLCLGDITPDGKIDDGANTNNGDMQKVLATVIEIILDFLDRHSQATVAFRRNTDSRMNLYNRIIKRYHWQYSHNYEISGAFERNDQLIAVSFDPNFQGQYEWYLIKRKY